MITSVQILHVPYEICELFRFEQIEGEHSLRHLFTFVHQTAGTQRHNFAQRPSTTRTMIIQTFKATIPSIGTACTLASVGIYLHSRGFIRGAEGKKTLALISQQVTIPLLLFTKVLYCTQDLRYV